MFYRVVDRASNALHHSFTIKEVKNIMSDTIKIVSILRFPPFLFC